MNEEHEQQAVERAEPGSTAKRVRRLVFVAAMPIAGVLLMFIVFQRSLIYFPSPEPLILPEDAGLPAGRVHTITSQTDDGLKLNGWLVSAEPVADGELPRQAGESAGGRMLALYFSGNAANRMYRVPEVTVLTELGVDVAIFDYRGYGENAGSPSEEGLAADARAMWQYAMNEGAVASSEQVVLVGESLGGGVATRLAAELCEAGTPPGGLILRSTFSSLVDAGAYHYPWLPVRIFLRDRFPSVERIGSVTCPVLIIHGTEDGIVPLELGQRLFAAAPEASQSGTAKQFVTLENAGHNDVLYAAREPYQAALRRFLEEIKRRAQ